ncbi:MAG: phosphoethanolamine--lipid A transferase [Gammaproteobacteria bacterium]|nr:phosphoethanolamine--lipid A transferase [Gammaproteobacteria bacterium]
MNSLFKGFTEITGSRLILLVSTFLIAFGNVTFFSNIVGVYPVNLKNSLFLLSLVIVFGGVTVLFLSFICHKYTIKLVLIIVLLVSSLASYFMDSYSLIIDEAMIRNVISTDTAESLDLISLKMILYIALLGVLPSVFVYRIKVTDRGLRKNLLSRMKLILLTLVSVVLVIVILGDFYASFFREHKPLRYYSNPTFYIHSVLRYINAATEVHAQALKMIEDDVKAPAVDPHRELMIFVVGETARADRFSLNGYQRETNPLLKQKHVVSFPNFWACGTSTAVSVPCMFSIFTHDEFSHDKALETENLLDVLKRSGDNVLWLDNNSDSKGVALRVPHQNYRLPENNPNCDIECRDEGMLAHIQEYIDEHDQGDIFIVLHQMGSHGPAYYKRYTSAFEKFTPSCHTNQLEDCSKEQIDNTYDNGILYTDYFLANVIDLLERNNDKFEPAMFYVSDHGESLGEHGLYLHGMPYFIAPEEQLHVPAIMWFGKNYHGVDEAFLEKIKSIKYSHDNIFHTVLDFMEVDTSIYNKSLDILSVD